MILPEPAELAISDFFDANKEWLGQHNRHHHFIGAPALFTPRCAHGETVRETANMISFMADIIGIRDDMYIGKGNTYMRNVSDYVKQGHSEGVLEQRPTLVNLQCDIDHPTQSTSDMLHIINHFGGVENLKGKKVAMTWAYSPSYGKPLSVPQGVIGLMTRFGMEARDFQQLAQLMADVIINQKSVQQDVAKFRKPFCRLRYCFDHDQIGKYLQEIQGLLLP